MKLLDIFISFCQLEIYSSIMLDSVLQQYGLTSVLEINTLKGGLINNTWKIICSDKQYILQRVNADIFSSPLNIASNIRNIGDYLHLHYPEYFFVSLIPTLIGEFVLFIPESGYYRLFPFVENSVTFSALESAELAFQAAAQFGRFTKLLANFPINELNVTLPNFHNLSLRYHQFEAALINGNDKRLKTAEDSIRFILENKNIVTIYEDILKNSNFKQRVTHHDTKINNVLFDKYNQGLCVIDLDTVMPGYFISDIGDMMRTYLSPVSEEERDYSEIRIREEYFKAILEGYLSEMKEELSDDELNYFVYAGKFIIYMQAIRFLTDYLLNDVYYGEEYPEHNLFRANNQIVLLQRLIEKEPLLEKLVLSSKY